MSNDAPPTSSIHPDVQQYCNIMIDQYKYQPIVPTDWPPPVGQDFFGRLALLQTQDRHATPQTILLKQWYMLRGQVDKIPQVTQDKQIDIQDVLKPCDSGQSLRVVVDGPPGIGKTTLCRKLLNMWAKRELRHRQYNLVLYCPLRNDKVAQASTLADLSVYQSPKVTKLVEWMTVMEGEGLLIIFDGWDELSTDLRQSSLAARIIRREILATCSVIVTSRSYASYSLLKIFSVNRHIEIIGFSEKEINEVVKGTLEKEPQLAEKLIQDLEIRGDVQSLCYVPLICSLVILVYRKSNGQLPITLTELYENFILQTIRRHVEIKSTHNIEPRQLHSLHNLPSVVDVPFKEMCQFAYLSLKESNPKMRFSLVQLHQSFDHSVKEGYFGLMTTFSVYDEESFQFLHLSIQEFLAAWWIAKYEKTEEVFADYFDNDHFRMCLRFIAGLTHLEHEIYQQYFNKVLDLQCKRKPLFGPDASYYSHFRQNSTITKPHCYNPFCDELDVFLIHLLFESQNIKLCKLLSQSMKNHSLCLHRVKSSLFDILCLGFFLNNSNITWNYLDLKLKGQEVQLLANTLMTSVQSKNLEISEWILNYDRKVKKNLVKLYQSSFAHNLHECYITLHPYTPLDLPDVSKILLDLIKQPNLKILHFNTVYWRRNWEGYLQIDKSILSKLEESLYINSILKELVLDVDAHVPNEYQDLPLSDIADIVDSVIKGVTKNKSIQTLSLKWEGRFLRKKRERNEETVKQLLRDNHTLQALKLRLPAQFISSLNIIEVNIPLTALEIEGSHRLTSILTQHIRGLHCLILHDPCPQTLLFQCHSNLQQLQLSLDAVDSVIELFTTLQSNTTLKTLRVEMKNTDMFDRVGPSLQDMLILNRTVKYLEILMSDFINTIPSTYLSFLTTGLSHNTSLQELSVPIPLSNTNYEQIKSFFNVIKNMEILTEIKVNFILDQTYTSSGCSYGERKQIMTPLFYEQGLCLISKVLVSHTTVKFFHIQCENVNKELSQHNWIELTQQFWQTIFLHPTLQYIGIKSLFAISVIKDTLQLQEKTLIDTHKHQQPLKPLPIIDGNINMDNTKF